MTAVVVQARLDSCRLEKKSLLPLDREPLVFRVMEVLNFIPCDLRVLACPEDCVTVFAPFAERAGFELSVGSKDDVLSRYCVAIRRFGIDRVIRATADNPFVFADAADFLNREAISLNADYAGYSGLPYGAGVESVNAEALLRAEREASLPPEREHVCPYLYSHPEWFQLHRPLAPREWQGPSLRVTVDTREDYERAMILYRVLSEQSQEAQYKYNGRNIIKTYHEVFCGKKTVRKRKLLANIA